MKKIWSFQWVATFVSATALLTLTACSSTRYERTTGEYVDDQRLALRVKRNLDAQPVYKYLDVKVETCQGVAQLSGFVAAPAQKDAATEIAERTRGVARVENNILIAPVTNETRAIGAPASNTGTISGGSTIR